MWAGDAARAGGGRRGFDAAVNDVARPLHDRMPVIVPPAAYAAWLSSDTTTNVLLPLLRPYPAGEMAAAAANPVVNSARYDGPDCLRAA